MESKLAQPLRFPDAPSLAPVAPIFDPAQNAWVLSRYRDVLAALREQGFDQAGPQKAPVRVREDVSSALSQSKVAEWQEQIEPLADHIIAGLTPGGSVDLVSEVIRPWSLAVTIIVLGLPPEAGRKLAALQACLLAELPASRRSRLSLKSLWRAAERKSASARLQKVLRGVRVRGAQSLFLGLSQTLPEFLANSWLTLLEHPSQLSRLRAESRLVPKAIEELLRHSGPVHTLVRESNRPIELGDVTIPQGQRVILKVALANRDPEQFPDPDSLDITRPNAGHLALGAGPHSCVGALLVRMAAISATRAFADQMAGAELEEPVVWRYGSVLRSPSCLRVRYGRRRVE
jgi:cytochrome P450